MTTTIETAITILTQERARIDNALQSLQGTSTIGHAIPSQWNTGKAKHRGPKPKNQQIVPVEAVTPFGDSPSKPVKRKMSAAGRKRIALAQKKRWAEKRKLEAKGKTKVKVIAKKKVPAEKGASAGAA